MLEGADKKPWNWPFVAKKSRTSVKKNDDDIAEGDEAGASVDGAGSWVGESDPSGVLSFSWHIAFACLIGVPQPPPRRPPLATYPQTPPVPNPLQPHTLTEPLPAAVVPVYHTVYHLFGPPVAEAELYF